MRLVEHAHDTELTHLLPKLPNPFDARRAFRADHGGTGGGETEAVLEVPVSVVEHDERNAADRLHEDVDVFDQVFEFMVETVGVVRIPAGIGGIHLGKGARNFAGHGDRIHRVEPDVQVERSRSGVGIVTCDAVVVPVVVMTVVLVISVVIVPMAVIVFLGILVVVPVLAVPVLTVMRIIVAVMMIPFEGPAFPQPPENEARRSRELDHPGVAGNRVDLVRERALHRSINEKHDIGTLEHYGVGGAQGIGVGIDDAPHHQVRLRHAFHHRTHQRVHRLDGGGDLNGGIGLH